jgi:voltage-gated potassium channel
MGSDLPVEQNQTRLIRVDPLCRRWLDRESLEQIVARLATRLRQSVYGVLESGPDARNAGRAVAWALTGLIAATLAATIVESVPRLAASYGSLLTAVECLALLIFSLEYVVRLWVAAEHPPWRSLGPIRARLRFAASPAGLVDLMAILPFWLSLVVAADFKVFLVLRLLRFFKLTRHEFVA